MNNLYHGFVYLWENTHPEAKKYKKYIGQHAGTINDGYIGSGKIFKDCFFSKKYNGFWKRTILEFCNSEEELNQAETRHILLHNALNSNLYCNLREGGNGGKMHPESCRKMSIAKKGKSTWNKGIPMTETARQKLKASLKGRRVWNKGLKGCYSLSVKTKSKIQESLSSFYNNKKGKERNLIIEHIEQHSFIKRKDISSVLGHKCSTTIITSRLNELIKQKIIKKIFFGKGDVRFVFINFSLDAPIEESIINYIKHTPKCRSRDIKSYVAIKCNVSPNKVRTVLKRLVQSNIVTKEQGYKTKLYSI